MRMLFSIGLLIVVMVRSVLAAPQVKPPSELQVLQFSVFDHFIRTILPKSWAFEEPAVKRLSEDKAIIEIIPKNESIDNYMNIFTLQVFKGSAHKEDLNSADVIQNVANYVHSLNPDKFMFTKLGEKTEGRLNSFMAVIGSGELREDFSNSFKKGDGEVSIFLCIKGEDNVYLINRSWNEDSYETREELVVSDEELRTWVRYLNSIRLVKDE